MRFVTALSAVLASHSRPVHLLPSYYLILSQSHPAKTGCVGVDEGVEKGEAQGIQGPLISDLRQKYLSIGFSAVVGRGD
jgi:hypothetical protein